MLIIGVLTNALTLMNVGSYWQDIVKGVILLLAISFDAIKNYPKPVVRVHKEKTETTKVA